MWVVLDVDDQEYWDQYCFEEYVEQYCVGCGEDVDCDVFQDQEGGYVLVDVFVDCVLGIDQCEY